MELDKHLLDHYKHSYYYELDRRDKIVTNLNLPISIAILIIGSALFLLNSSTLCLANMWSMVFLALLFCSVSCIVISVFYIYKALTGYEYKYISLPTEINEYVNQHLKYNDAVSKNKQISTEEAFFKLLQDQYCMCSTINAQHNDARIDYVRRTWISLLVTIIALGLTNIAFLVMRHV